MRVIFSLSYLASSLLALSNNIDSGDYETPLNMYLSGAMSAADIVTAIDSDDSSSAPSTEQGGRSISASTSAFSKLSLLDDYGCWCRSFGRVAGGRPRDFLDHKCKMMHTNLRCALRTSDCQKDTPYNAGNIGKTIGKALVMKAANNIEDSFRFYKRALRVCDVENDNDCAASICKIEVKFIYSVSLELSQELIQNEAAYNDAFSAENFDSAACTVSNPIEDRALIDEAHYEMNMVCCGEIPDAVTFNSNNPSMMCCAGSNVVYNPVSQCCKRGEVSECSDETL